MRKSFKFGFGNGKQMLAATLLLAGTLGPASLHAEEKRSTVARLQIQVIVMPVVAAQQAQRPAMQPSQSTISFDFSPNSKQSGNYSTQTVTVIDQRGASQTAVLKTLTMLPE